MELDKFIYRGMHARIHEYKHVEKSCFGIK